MSWQRVTVFALASLVALAGSCSRGKPCLTQDDCNIGTYCERGGGSGFDEGTCVRDCVSAEDCSVDGSEGEVAVCNNEGRCRVSVRPPRLRVLEPENDLLLEEGTRSIRLVGEVQTSNAQAVVEIEPSMRTGCASGDTQTITLTNKEPGKWVTLSFVTDEVPVDPGTTRLKVKASVGTSRDTLEHLLEVPCPGCADVVITNPPATSSILSGLELPKLEGNITPADMVNQISWRVRSENGDVLDGGASVIDGRFAIDRVPLFAGKNRIQIVVTGIGSGLGESRCSTFISAGAGPERGLRGLLVWDGPTSDLDLHIIGPGGTFGDRGSDLSVRGGRFLFDGSVTDDFDGLGPETVTAQSPPDGVYGVVVEPVYDDQDAGANAFVRLLWNGRLLVPGPIGPAFLSSADGSVYVAGTITIERGAAEWHALGVTLSQPPTRPPSDWPNFN